MRNKVAVIELKSQLWYINSQFEEIKKNKFFKKNMLNGEI